MAGFCELAIGLRAPKLAAAGAKSPIVSDGYLKYSRFWETAPGDRGRSGLRGGRGSAFGGISRYGRWSGRTGDNGTIGGRFARPLGLLRGRTGSGEGQSNYRCNDGSE